MEGVKGVGEWESGRIVKVAGFCVNKVLDLIFQMNE